MLGSRSANKSGICSILRKRRSGFLACTTGSSPPCCCSCAASHTAVRSTKRGAAGWRWILEREEGVIVPLAVVIFFAGFASFALRELFQISNAPCNAKAFLCTTVLLLLEPQDRCSWCPIVASSFAWMVLLVDTQVVVAGPSIDQTAALSRFPGSNSKHIRSGYILSILKVPIFRFKFASCIQTLSYDRALIGTKTK